MASSFSLAMCLPLKTFVSASVPQVELSRGGRRDRDDYGRGGGGRDYGRDYGRGGGDRFR